MRKLGLIFFVSLFSCQYYNGKLPLAEQREDSAEMLQAKRELPDPASKAADQKSEINTLTINTGATKPEQVLSFAQTLIGVPYRYGSSDPVNGFDCSGFITYVFNHFNITVPRSSIDFTNYRTQVELDEAKPGDLILFTGTDSTVREVGHMGIITTVNNDLVEFIHSSSGRANGVTITPVNKYYLGRFVKVIRIF